MAVYETYQFYISLEVMRHELSKQDYLSSSSSSIGSLYFERQDQTDKNSDKTQAVQSFKFVKLALFEADLEINTWPVGICPVHDIDSALAKSP